MEIVLRKVQEEKFEKLVVGCEDHWDKDQGKGDNYIDVIIVIVHLWEKLNGQWKRSHILDMIQICGSLNKRIYWESYEFGQGGWQVIFNGYPDRYAYKLYLQSWVE